MRKAVHEFDLIDDGDVVAVGVSGGKDSLVLLNGLIQLRKFIGIEFTLVAITLDMGFGGERTDFSSVERLCAENGVRYIIEPTVIGQVVFDIRKEENPCSLCARMRRGALHDAAIAAGCNKIALGHHRDDAVETFVMNLFVEGRVGCFAPKTYLSKKDLYMIRPLCLAPEKDVRRAVRDKNIQIVKSKCPADGHTKRQEIKEYLAEVEKTDKGFKDRLFGAMRRGNIDGWGYKNPSEAAQPKYHAYKAVMLSDFPQYRDEALQLLEKYWEAAAPNFRKYVLEAMQDGASLPNASVALKDGRVVGVAAVLECDEVPDTGLTPWAGFVFVEKAHRARRVSELMLKMCEEYAAALGYNYIYLSTDHIQLYENYGYYEYKLALNMWNQPTKIYRKKIV